MTKGDGVRRQPKRRKSARLKITNQGGHYEIMGIRGSMLVCVQEFRTLFPHLKFRKGTTIEVLATLRPAKRRAAR